MTTPARKARLTPIRPGATVTRPALTLPARIAGTTIGGGIVALLGSLIVWGLVEVWQGILG